MPLSDLIAPENGRWGTSVQITLLAEVHDDGHDRQNANDKSRDNKRLVWTICVINGLFHSFAFIGTQMIKHPLQVARRLLEVHERDYDQHGEEAEHGHQKHDQVLPIVATNAIVDEKGVLIKVDNAPVASCAVKGHISLNELASWADALRVHFLHQG